MSQAVTPADLERAFRRVHVERMQDVPILNPALEVAAIGFREWEGFQLGVLLTPWFMNLVLLPGENEAWPGLRPGESRQYSLASGTYEFLLGEQEDIGRYLACSMLSPVFEFTEQATAVAAADEIMRLVLEPPQTDECVENPEAEIETGAAAEAELSDEALSRRRFLRGRLFGRGS